MSQLTPEGTRSIDDIARRRALSVEAVTVLLEALSAGGGGQAQFNHADLGGMGQWQGGTIMIGDMFNHGLKTRVTGAIDDLVEAMRDRKLIEAPSTPSQGRGNSGWPAALGRVGAGGAQDGLRYAIFPDTRRLAIDRAGALEIYDIADHVIHGVSQQQWAGADIVFTSQHGPIDLKDLRRVNG